MKTGRFHASLRMVRSGPCVPTVAPPLFLYCRYISLTRSWVPRTYADTVSTCPGAMDTQLAFGSATSTYAEPDSPLASTRCALPRGSKVDGTNDSSRLGADSGEPIRQPSARPAVGPSTSNEGLGSRFSPPTWPSDALMPVIASPAAVMAVPCCSTLFVRL